MLKSNKFLLYITASAMSITLWTSTVFAQQNKTGVTTASMLNMRQSPNTSTQIIDQIPRGYKVSIIETSNGWYKVVYNNKTGWIYGGYVTITETPSSDVAVIDETLVSGDSSSKTNFSNPTPSNPTPSNPTPSNNNSSDIVVDETLLNLPNPSNNKNQNTVIKTGTVQASILNIRSGAGTGNSIIGKLARGEMVNIVSQKDGWYQIKLSNGSIGWVYGTYVIENTTVTRGGSDATIAVPENTETGNVTGIRQQVVEYAKKFLGIRYTYGGNTPAQGFDCSGFVKYVFTNFNINLNRVAADQAKQGTWISKDSLLPGDLVFFDTNGGHNYINHVGIYIGDGKFIHSSSGSNRGVVISELMTGFYANSYMTGRRVLN
ncbi:MAG: SH3 domain-containing protein [Clostridium sp.]|nr:SH3 domain-containing protein [Clostridium sp.]